MNAHNQIYLWLGAVLAALCVILVVVWRRCRFGDVPLFGRILFDDDEPLIAFGLVGGLRATLKSTGITVLASQLEKRCLFAAVAELQRLGVPIAPGSEPFERLLRDFSQAVILRLSEMWAEYFIAFPPQAKALRYAFESPRQS